MSLSLAARTHGTLARHGLRAEKGLSQNFLVDEEALSRIVSAINPQKSHRILEVGAGLGFLTEALAAKAGGVLAVEIDEKLFPILTERLAGFPHAAVLRENILKFHPDKYFQNERFTAAGNLPYHLSGLILRWFFDHRDHFTQMFFMLQKEVAERLTAKPRSKAYGVLSLLCQYFTIPEILFAVPAESFFPMPKVESAFVKLRVKPEEDCSCPMFVPLVKAAFAQRRKMLFNNLKFWKIHPPETWKKILNHCEIDPHVRAEELSLEQFALLAGHVSR